MNPDLRYLYNVVTLASQELKKINQKTSKSKSKTRKKKNIKTKNKTRKLR